MASGNTPSPRQYCYHAPPLLQVLGWPTHRSRIETWRMFAAVMAIVAVAM